MMRNFFLVFLMLIANSAFSQSRISITGNMGRINVNKENHFLLNGSVDYRISEKVKTGIDFYGVSFKAGGDKIKLNQVFAYLEYSPSALRFFGEKLSVSAIAGPGMGSYKTPYSRVNFYSTLVASKVNYQLTKSTSIGLKPGFTFNKHENSGFFGVYVSYTF